MTAMTNQSWVREGSRTAGVNVPGRPRPTSGRQFDCCLLLGSGRLSVLRFAFLWSAAVLCSAAFVFAVFPLECGSALLCRFSFSGFVAVFHSPRNNSNTKAAEQSTAA